MTKENEFEYYKVTISNTEDVPLISEDDDCPIYLYKKVAIENPKLMQFKLAEPIPRKPVLADYLSTPSSVVSKKIFNVLEPLKIYGIQLLPAKIRGKDNKLVSGYWAIHIFNNIKCVDKKLSDCKIEDGLGYVNKIVLDKKVLKKIPLKERLIFRLEEDRAYQLFHASIVEKIMAVNPTGVKFTDIEKWNDGSYFEE